MANTIAERSVQLLRKQRDGIATRCDLWLEQTRALLADAFRTDVTPNPRGDLAVLEDRVLLSATPIVEALELAVTQSADVVNGDTDRIQDLKDNDGGDGVSLREAILAANKEDDPVTIILGPGTYRLEIVGMDNTGRRGDLDLNGDIDIQGAGSGLTIVDASGITGGDRIFHVRNGADVSIQGLTVTGGQGKEGAGILIEEATTLTLEDVVVSGNHASGQDGGGIFNREGMIRLTDVTIADNSAYNKEGGGIHSEGIAILNRVTVSGNHAKDGAGIYSEGSDALLKLTNVTISGNHASDKGGGLYVKEQAEILHSTIAFNTAVTGGGIEEAGAVVSLKSSILAKNFYQDGVTALNVTGMLVSFGYNVDSDGTAGLAGPGDQSNVDPLLDRDLAFNGGKTQTHALMGSSVAIDVPGLRGAPAVDQRNATRDATPDAGAYEYYPSANVAPTDIRLSHSRIAGSRSGAIVGALVTIDPTTPESHHYVVDDARFEIVGDQLQLKAGESIEYADESTVTLLIQSTDSGGNSISKVFVLTTTSPPTVTDSQDFQTVEFAANGTVIGTLQATDPDSDALSFHWTIIDGNESGIFALDAATGELTVADDTQLDFTAAPRHSLTVTVSDESATAAAAVVMIEVLNAAPTDITLSDSTLAGGTAGAVVGQLTSDDRTMSESHTYRVDDVRFEVVGQQLRLKADETIEPTHEPTITLQIESIDTAGNTFAKSFVLIVTDNPPPAPTESKPPFLDDPQLDLGNLNVSQEQHQPNTETASDGDFGDGEPTTEDPDDKAGDADVNAEANQSAELLATLEREGMHAAHTAKVESAKGSTPPTSADAWQSPDFQRFNGAGQMGLALETGQGSAESGSIADPNREADAAQAEFRTIDDMSRRIGLVQRAVVQPQLWQALESMHDEVHQSVASIPLKIGATATTTAGITAGYVVWVLRSGLLMSTAFANLPMWRFMDPLTILDSKAGGDEEDGESLHTLVAEESPADEQDSREPISSGVSADV